MSSPALKKFQPKKTESPLLKQWEAAEYLRISRWTLAKLGLPTVVIGGRRFYRKRDLEIYIKRNVVRGG